MLTVRYFRCGCAKKLPFLPEELSVARICVAAAFVGSALWLSAASQPLRADPFGQPFVYSPEADHGPERNSRHGTQDNPPDIAAAQRSAKPDESITDGSSPSGGVSSIQRDHAGATAELPAVESSVASSATNASANETSADGIAASVVQIEATVPADARTAANFGEKRIASGIAIDAHGLIVTAGYVIAEAQTVEVSLHNGTRLDADIVAYDDASGLGLIRARGETQAARIAPPDAVKEKNTAFIVSADPAVASEKVTIGKVKAFTGGWGYTVDDAIHTYPPTTDFSGAALIDAEERLMGIGVLVSIDIDIDPKIRVPGNIFVPVNRLVRSLGELMTAGRSTESKRPWLGLHAKQTRNGLTVGRVDSDGPAAQSGIAAGDIIVAIDQVRVSGLSDFYDKLWKMHNPGDAVHLLLIRGERYANVPVQSVDRYDWLKLQTPETLLSEIDQ